MNGPSGSRLLVETNHDLPIVRVTATLRTGGADDPPALDGLANYSTELMARGAAGRSRKDLDRAFDALGATLTIHTEYDGAHFEIAVLKTHLDAALALVSDVLLRPDFPVEEGEKLVRETLAQIDELREEDSLVARRFMTKRLFDTHPYGRTLTGTSTTLPRMAPDAARAWHDRAMRGPGIVFSFAGDIEPAEASALVEKHLASLPTGDAADFAKPHPVPVQRTGTRITLVDKPERTQSQILFGQVAPSWRVPEFDALHVAMHAFGGTFTSRLMDEVRAKRGLSYGASARLGQGRGPRSIVVNVFPSLEQTVETVTLVRGLLDDLARNGLPEEAIAFGRDNLRDSFAFNLATPEEKLDLRLTAELAGLPDDYVERFAERIAAVQPADANAAIEKYLRPDDLEIVIVTTADELRPLLEEAGLLKDALVEVVPYDVD